MIAAWAWREEPGSSEKSIRVQVVLPKGALRVEGGVGVETLFVRDEVVQQTLMVKELTVPCVIGVNAHERLEKQIVVINLIMNGAQREHQRENCHPIIRAVVEVSQQTLKA